MSKSMAKMVETDSWGGLLEQTRHALSTLRTDDLEELAARAERMFDAALGRESLRQGGAELCGAELVKVAAEHRLLGHLLRATGSNLDVLRRLQGRIEDRTLSGAGHSRWVR